MLLQLRVAKAAATAYEILEEYAEEARDCLNALNPLKAKEKKINLLTDDDEEEEEVCYHDNNNMLTHSIYRLVFLRS